MLLAALLGWRDREQRDVIAFLREENCAAQGTAGQPAPGPVRRRQRMGGLLNYSYRAA